MNPVYASFVMIMLNATSGLRIANKLCYYQIPFAVVLKDIFMADSRQTLFHVNGSDNNKTLTSVKY